MLVRVLFPQTFKKFSHLDVDFKSVHTAAIIVSASVTFIALLSCGNVARTAGLGLHHYYITICVFFVCNYNNKYTAFYIYLLQL